MHTFCTLQIRQSIYLSGDNTSLRNPREYNNHNNNDDDDKISLAKRQPHPQVKFIIHRLINPLPFLLYCPEDFELKQFMLNGFE